MLTSRVSLLKDWPLHTFSAKDKMIKIPTALLKTDYEQDKLNFEFNQTNCSTMKNWL